MVALTPKLFAAVVLPVLLAGCDRQPRTGPLKEPPPAPTSEDSIHVGPLNGKLDGQPFTVKTARYFVDTRPGFERVEIKLYGVGSKTPCGELDSPKPPTVWLRRLGPAQFGHSKTSTTVKDGGEWEVHYQVQDDGFWLGYGEANALLVLEAPDPDRRLSGILSACFRDHAGSCIAGEFSASLCHLGIDEPVRGTEVMERPPKRPLGAGSASASALPSTSAGPSASVAPSASASGLPSAAPSASAVPAPSGAPSAKAKP